MMASKQTSYVGVFDRVKWRAPDESNRIIGTLEDGVTVLGVAEEGELVPGLPYEFFGIESIHEDYGKQLKFTMFTQKEPHSRHGVVAYLERYAPGVGPAVATRLWDAFGADAVKTLRTQPEAVVAIATIGRFLTLEKAQAASQALKAIAELEDTKIELTNLFAGRGFPGVLIEECITRWRILAPARIRRDPFSLLVYEMPGCGFARCDRLYTDLGLPLDRLKRQVICLWHVLHSDSSGNTWVPAEVAVERLGSMVSGAKVRPKKAILLGCRAGWLARRKDDAGKLWLAEGDRARAEAYLAEKLVELSKWELPTQGASHATGEEETDRSIEADAAIERKSRKA